MIRQNQASLYWSPHQQQNTPKQNLTTKDGGHPHAREQDGGYPSYEGDEEPRKDQYGEEEYIPIQKSAEHLEIE